MTEESEAPQPIFQIRHVVVLIKGAGFLRPAHGTTAQKDKRKWCIGLPEDPLTPICPVRAKPSSGYNVGWRNHMALEDVCPRCLRLLTKAGRGLSAGCVPRERQHP